MYDRLSKTDSYWLASQQTFQHEYKVFYSPPQILKVAPAELLSTYHRVPNSLKLLVQPIQPQLL